MAYCRSRGLKFTAYFYDDFGEWHSIETIHRERRENWFLSKETICPLLEFLESSEGYNNQRVLLPDSKG